MSKLKILCIVLIIGLLVVSFAGCSSTTSTGGTTTTQKETEQEQEQEEQEVEEEEESPNIPHVLDGRDSCLGCHNTSTNVPVPADHEGRTDSSCTACHALASNPSSTTATAIPHSLEGRSNCLACHAEGTSAGVPVSHKGRTIEVCTACHQPE